MHQGEDGQSVVVLTKPEAKRNKWLRFGGLVVALVAVSFGLAYLLQSLLSPFQTELYRFAWLAYLVVFGITLLGSLTIVAPVPVATAIIIAVATRWDPILVALSASIGGSLGELSGYYAGYIGKTKLINGNEVEHSRVTAWMKRYGLWAVFFLALQPILPFDIAGLAAGASRLPAWKFLLALWPGKFIKCTVLCYSGAGLLHLLPRLTH